MNIILETVDYRAILLDTTTNPVATVITFDHFRGTHSFEDPYDFEKVENESYLTKSGFNHIHIQTRRNDWYERPSINEICESVRELKTTGDVFISYGTSMGGYGAAALSEKLGCDFFLAVSPQASINDDFLISINDNRWLYDGKIISNDGLLNQACSNVKGFVSVDPDHEADFQHAKKISEVTDAGVISCYGASHTSGISLNRDVGIKKMLADVSNAIKSKKDPLTLISGYQHAVDNGFCSQFYKASSEVRFKLFINNGVQESIRQFSSPSLLRLFRQDQSEHMAGIMCLIANEVKPAQKQAIALQLMKNGYVGLAVPLLNPNLELSGFITPNNLRDFRGHVSSIGVDKFQSEALRLEEVGMNRLAFKTIALVQRFSKSEEVKEIHERIQNKVNNAA